MKLCGNDTMKSKPKNTAGCGGKEMFTKIGEERAFDAILGQIIENIQTGELKAGDALPAERSMAESMGVSRPAVREVLRAL